MYLEERSHHDSQAIHVGWTSVANACVHKFNELDDKQKSEKSKILINIIFIQQTSFSLTNKIYGFIHTIKKRSPSCSSIGDHL